MFIRMVVLIAGLFGGFGTAQFPAYSQQYMQRLGGAVGALSEVVAHFDASASALGLTRQGALEQKHGSAFIERRRLDMQRTFERFETLSADLALMREHGPFMCAYHVGHLADRKIALGAWKEFQPALPLDLASVLFGLVGFAASGLGAAMLARLLRPVLRRRAMPA
jgi:hypothetical protein